MKPSETAAGSAERKLFVRALEIPAGQARAAFIEGACVGKPELRRRLEVLLQQFEALGTFLEEPMVPLPEVVPAAGAPELLTQTVEMQGVREKPGDWIGRYKLLQPIGEGGCGIVYMAEQEEPVRRRVALKVIKLGMDTRQVIARFEAERQALALMDHPNIAKVLDAGATETGRPYFVMELVRGIKITDYCDQNNLSTRQRLDLFIAVCQAIQHAHQKGIIHRDIKPSNILVTLHDGVPVPKVIDFGIAKATEGRLTDQTLFTAFEQFIGTPAYMSPEQAEMSGLDIDTRSDIYSLGVLLYELLTGRTPLDTKELLAAGIDELRRTIREKDPMRPSTRLQSLLEEEQTTAARRRGVDVPRLIHLLSGDLDWIVMKCLEKDRTRRYETAIGLATDLKRHLSNEPVSARPPSTAYRLRKAIRRHKLAFTAAGAVAAALALGVVGSTWQAVVATRAKREADASRKAADQNAALARAESHRANAAKHDAEENLLNANRNLYVAQMNLAGACWDQNNVREVRQLLEDTKGYPDRGFEWYYWQRQLHLDLKTFRGHANRVLAVAFSAPDGRRLVTASADHTARIWDAASGMEPATLAGHQAAVLGVAFSPDGHRIVTCSADQTARVWDATTGKQVLLLRGHVGAVRSVAFSPDGRRVATASGDRTAIIWDANTGEEVLRLRGHTRGVNAVAFSPDGKWVLTGGSDHTARLWDAVTGAATPPLEGHREQVNAVAFSPDGRRIITGSEDWSARVWDAVSRQVLFTLQTQRAVYSVAFSADGRRIATAHWSDPVRLWDAANGQQLFTIKGHSGSVNSLAFSPDGRRILTGSDDRTAKLWDVERDRAEITLRGHTDWIWSVAISSDGQRVVTGSFDHTARVWDSVKGAELLALAGDIGRVLGVAFSTDGQRIAAWSDPGGAVYDAASGQSLFPLKPAGGITMLAFSSDRRIFTLSARNRVGAWNLDTGKALPPLFEQNRSGLQPIALSPDGRRVLTTDQNQRAEIWEVGSGKSPIGLPAGLNGLDAAVFSSDGQRLITMSSGSRQPEPRVWNAVTGEEQLTLRGHNGGANWASFFPDGHRIVTAGFDGTCRVWDAATGKELLELAARANFDFHQVVVSADGRRIVAGGTEKIAKIWEAATKEQAEEWQAEEATAERRLAEPSHQQLPPADLSVQNSAPDPSRITQWLVLAPIPMPGRTHDEALAALERQELPNEGQLHPRADERVVVDGAELVWRPVRLADATLNLNEFLGAVTEWSVGYAVCYIQTDQDQKGVVVKVNRDDWAKIFLNGAEIYHRDEEYIAPPDWDLDTAAGLDLRAGSNTLVLKLVNEEGDWMGSVRFTDAAGQPLKGIRVTLTPPAAAPSLGK